MNVNIYHKHKDIIITIFIIASRAYLQHLEDVHMEVAQALAPQVVGDVTNPIVAGGPHCFEDFIRDVLKDKSSDNYYEIKKQYGYLLNDEDDQGDVEMQGNDD